MVFHAVGPRPDHAAAMSGIASSSAAADRQRGAKHQQPENRCAYRHRPSRYPIVGSAMKEPRPAQLDCAVLGLGSCGLDTLALVDSFPAPDEKIRARRLLIQGGGNCANALTAAARLGAPVAIISKAGSDAAGSSIEAELQGEGIDTQCLLFSKTGPSPTTYIIVDAAGGTRTCIHSPGEDMTAAEGEALGLERGVVLSSATKLVFLDGRHPEAAVQLLGGAHARGVPVLVEAEKPRPGLDVLLQGAQYVYTNATFPKTWTQELSLGSALLCMLRRLTSARWLVTTLGPSGLVAFQRQEGSGEPIDSGADLDRLMQKLWDEADARRKGTGGSEEAACTALNGSLIRVGACASGHLQLQDGTGFGVLVHQAASLETEVVDTTGAGDAFLGSLLVSVSVGASLEAAAKLGTVVAAAKCTELGARTGMPHLAQLHPSLQGVLESRRAA
ncbi:hypothetical protein ACKKBG_A25310 [Auxenochlorella protothecoides x Auxenochlorella symbiontica]